MESWWIPYACLFGAALASSLLLTPLAKRIAVRLDAVDYPGSRRINKTPIPRMGGIAVFSAIIIATIVQLVGSSQFGWPVIFSSSPLMQVNYAGLAVSFALIFAVGAIDDVCQLKPLPKLIGQIAAACVAVASGLVIGVIVNPFTGGIVDLGLIAYPVTVLYLVAYTNVINLVDGLDGLATGITCISALTLFVLARMAGRLDAAALAIIVTGATLGFLGYNFHPASIFLGDSGALLLGFSLGSITLLNVTRVAGLTTMILPLTLSGIPILDTFSAIIRRQRAHVSVGQADRGHIHHRLIQEGFDQRQAVIFIYAWTLLLCAGSFVITQVAPMVRIVVFLSLMIASFLFAWKLKMFEPVLRHHWDPETGKDVLITPDDPAFELEEQRERNGE